MTDETADRSGVVIEEVDEPIDDLVDELLEDDDDDETELEPDVVDEVARMSDTEPPGASAQHLERADAHLVEASGKFQSALSQLRTMKARRVVQRARPLPPAPDSAVAPVGQPATPPNPSRTAIAALEALADAEGDGQVARALWDWISARSRKLELGGLRGLSRRWSIVLHALGAEATFGRNEWRPR